MRLVDEGEIFNVMPIHVAILRGLLTERTVLDLAVALIPEIKEHTRTQYLIHFPEEAKPGNIGIGICFKNNFKSYEDPDMAYFSLTEKIMPKMQQRGMIEADGTIRKAKCAKWLRAVITPRGRRLLEMATNQ